jgi:signal transduction histidine kinase
MEADLAEMGSMVASLLAYLGGEADPEKTVRIDIAVMAATLVDEYVDLGRDATYDGVEHLEWCLRPTAMRRAVGNLLENALHYGESAQVRVQKTGNGFTIMVEDDGPGIPPDKIDTVLRPFTRLDTARQRNTKGLGLGLAIVSRTVEREGGSLSLANRPEGGLRATITIPREA